MIQTADLGANSGALMVHFVHQHGVRRAFINAPGTSAIWLADDDDGNGVYDFQQVLGGPADGVALPVDMLLSHDGKFMYVSNWFGNTVQRFDIADPFHPVLKATVSVPHPNMLRLSRDNDASTSRTRCSRRGTTTPTSGPRGTTSTGSGCSTWTSTPAA